MDDRTVCVTSIWWILTVHGLCWSLYAAKTPLTQWFIRTSRDVLWVPGRVLPRPGWSWTSPQMLHQIWMWGVWNPGEQLSSVVFLGPLLSSFSLSCWGWQLAWRTAVAMETGGLFVLQCLGGGTCQTSTWTSRFPAERCIRTDDGCCSVQLSEVRMLLLIGGSVCLYSDTQS